MIPGANLGKPKMPKDLEELQKMATKAGTNLTELCRRAGVARSTPTRWLGDKPKAAPNTRTLDKLRVALRDYAAERTKELAELNGQLKAG